jgi:peptidyl-prolyl cis-trans isomerase C
MMSMAKNSVLPSASILVLSLGFVFTGLIGCSRGSSGEQSAAPASAPAAAAAPTASAPATSAKPTATPAPASASGPAGAAAPAAQPIQPEKLPAVVARVNGQDIKKDDLVKGVQQVSQRLQGAPAGDPAVYHQVLDAMIARTLLEQEAKAEGVTVSDDEVKKQIDQLRTQMGSADAFKKELEREGITEDQLTAEARRGVTVQKFIETKIAPTVTVTDAAAKTFYDQNTDKLKQPERVHIRQIMVKAGDKATVEDKKKAKDKADGLLIRLKAGEDFGKLARENSDSPDGKDGGSDAWLSKGQQGVPPSFEAAAFALKKTNDLSPVIESPFGYHIVLLMGHEDAGIIPFPEVKERITGYLKDKETQDKLHERVAALRSKGKIEVFL